MIQLAYTSTASVPFSTDMLKRLLRQSRSANVPWEITGILLYHLGAFFQVLEGPEASVGSLLASLRRDTRHRGIRILFRRPLEKREFTDWTMAFVDTSLWRLDGFVGYSTQLPELLAGETAAKRYLRLFHQGIGRQTPGVLSKALF